MLILSLCWSTTILWASPTDDLLEGLIENELSLDQVKALVKQGADIQAKYTKPRAWCSQMRPIHIAAAWTQKDIIEYFIQKGANPKEQITYPEGTSWTATKFKNCAALAIAIKYADAEKEEVKACLNYLVQQGENIDQFVYGGQSLMMWALMSEHSTFATIKWLADKGADLNAVRKKSNWKETVFYYAANDERDRSKELKYLMKKGATNLGEIGDWSLLNYYSYYSYNKLAKIVVDAGLTHPNEKNSNEYGSSLNIAALRGNIELAYYFLQLGADPNVKGYKGKSAFDYATETGNDKMLQLLKTKKIDQAELDWIALTASDDYKAIKFMNKKADDFLMRDLNGKTISLKGLKGKVVFLNFWATWCPPCIREMPDMQNLHEKLGPKGFVIVANSLDKSTNYSKVKSFVADNSYTFTIGHEPENEMVSKYPTSLPGTYLIDKNGFAVARIDGAIPWSEDKYVKLIEALLNRK